MIPSRKPQDQSRTTAEKQLTRRLLWKSVALFGAVVLILLSIATAIITHDATVDTEERMFREASRLRDVLVMTMLDEAEKKRERASRFIGGFAKDSLIHEVRVVTNDTVVAFSSESSEVGAKLDLVATPLCKNCHRPDKTLKSEVSEYRDSLGERHMHLVLPIENTPACQKCHDDVSPIRATMLVDFSLRHLDEAAAQTRFKLFGLLFILLIAFVILIHALLTTAVYQPLLVIADRLQGIARGYFTKYTGKASGSSENIIGYIHRHIDTAAHQLEASYEVLEREVADRTRSLKESEDALRRERNKLQLILDGAPCCILESTTDGDITFANSRTKELIGTQPAETLGKNMRDISTFREILEGDTLQKVRRGESLYRIERGTQRITADESNSRYIDVQATRVESLEGKPALLIMLIDATLEREVEAHLERHERLAAVGQLAAGVAHEVGNPLSAISSITQLMKENLQDEDQRTHLELIAYHIGRINRIVRSLSRFSRTPTDHLEKTTISSIIQAALEIARFDERASGVAIETSYPENEKERELPRDSLMQAFINIIMNGFDAVKGSDSPKLTIAVTQIDNETSVSFSDNGHGISESDKRKVVEPFFTTKAEGAGTGLGLFVTHKIVEELNGRLDIDSREGEGATFTITVPHGDT